MSHCRLRHSDRVTVIPFYKINKAASMIVAAVRVETAFELVRKGEPRLHVVGFAQQLVGLRIREY